MLIIQNVAALTQYHATAEVPKNTFTPVPQEKSKQKEYLTTIDRRWTTAARQSRFNHREAADDPNFDLARCVTLRSQPVEYAYHEWNSLRRPAYHEFTPHEANQAVSRRKRPGQPL